MAATEMEYGDRCQDLTQRERLRKLYSISVSACRMRCGRIVAEWRNVSRVQRNHQQHSLFEIIEVVGDCNQLLDLFLVTSSPFTLV